MALKTWYYAQEDRAVGPISERDLSSLIKNKMVPRNALVFSPAMTDWQQACSRPEFINAAGLPTPVTRKRKIQQKAIPKLPTVEDQETSEAPEKKSSQLVKFLIVFSIPVGLLYYFLIDNVFQGFIIVVSLFLVVFLGIRSEQATTRDSYSRTIYLTAGLMMGGATFLYRQNLLLATAITVLIIGYWMLVPPWLERLHRIPPWIRVFLFFASCYGPFIGLIFGRIPAGISFGVHFGCVMLVLVVSLQKISEWRFSKGRPVDGEKRKGTHQIRIVQVDREMSEASSLCLLALQHYGFHTIETQDAEKNHIKAQAKCQRGFPYADIEITIAATEPERSRVHISSKSIHSLFGMDGGANARMVENMADYLRAV